MKNKFFFVIRFVLCYNFPVALSLWKKIQTTNFVDRKKLLAFLSLEEGDPYFPSSFPLNLPYRLASKIEKGNWNDPILKQFLPSQEEEAPSSFSCDPVQEREFRKEEKLLQKYQGRALLVATGACTMHCRYCFRRHFDYGPKAPYFEKEIAKIREDSSLTEIILSGGDPLSLGEEALGRLLHEIDQIPHLERVRFHTRFPIGIPERIDPLFLQQLQSLHKQVIFVVHVNHPRELDEEIFFHLKEVQKLGIPVLTQSVLLQGVNDSVEVLQELVILLVNHGILPYYLHQLDQVKGASHFEVEERKGRELISELRSCVPGYAVPQYVREEPFLMSKKPIVTSL